jgi:flagellin
VPDYLMDAAARGRWSAGRDAGFTFTEEIVMAAFSVVTNVTASAAQANLANTSMNLQKAITRLSSGLRINSAGDDAAGLAVANQYRNTQATLNQGVQNANDGLSTLQIKDGAMSNISTLLDRLSTLAAQSASGSSSVDRTAMNSEFTDVLSEIDREANVAGVASSDSFSVFVSNDGTNGTVGGTINAADTTTLGISSLTVDTATNASAAVAKIASAVKTLGSAQSTIGTLQNRLQFAISLANTQIVNSQAAESRLRDANIAQESANMTRYNILNQSGIAALAQANQQSQSILTLLR